MIAFVVAAIVIGSLLVDAWRRWRLWRQWHRTNTDRDVEDRW